MRQCSWQTYVISHVIRVQKASPVLVNTLASVNGPINSYTSCAQKRNTFLQSFARDLYAKPVSSELTLIVYAEPLHSLLNACVLPNRNGKVAQARVGSTAIHTTINTPAVVVAYTLRCACAAMVINCGRKMCLPYNYSMYIAEIQGFPIYWGR